jgi:hypothetical protein
MNEPILRTQEQRPGVQWLGRASLPLSLLLLSLAMSGFALHQGRAPPIR